METLKTKVINQNSPAGLEEETNEFLEKVNKLNVFQIDYLQSFKGENYKPHYTSVITYIEPKLDRGDFGNYFEAIDKDYLKPPCDKELISIINEYGQKLNKSTSFEANMNGLNLAVIINDNMVRIPDFKLRCYYNPNREICIKYAKEAFFEVTDKQSLTSGYRYVDGTENFPMTQPMDKKLIFDFFNKCLINYINFHKGLPIIP